VNYTVSATDALDGDVPVVCAPSSGSAFPAGTTVVHCVAHDAHFNYAFGDFNVTVTNGPPALTVPEDFRAEATEPGGATVDYDVSATGSATVSCTPASGTLFPFGNTLVSCTATNVFGSVSASFNVYVIDLSAPTLTLPTPVVDATSDAGAIVNYTATATDLVDGGFARVASRWGTCVLKVVVSDRQRRGSLFAPIHWSDETASAARICDLVMPETDRYSGQPDAKATPAAIAPIPFAYRGFALTRHPAALPGSTWWARVTVANGHGLLLATNAGAETWRGAARQMFGDGAELAEYADAQRGIYRAAAFVEGQLAGCLFIGPAETAPQWDAVKALFEAETLGDDARRVLLSGRSADGLVSAGPIVCACFSVGLATIRDAIQSGAATNVETIGQALRAGTNCGSCLPELKRIIVDERIAHPL